MEISRLKILGAFLIKPNKISDDRGYFYESYRTDIYNKEVAADKYVQENTSVSKHGVIRGLHFQNPKWQSKLVKCVYGRICDVLVDLRVNLDIFGKHETVILSEGDMVYIPCGVAHGFAVLSDSAQVSYKCGEYYYPEYESGIVWNDKYLNIDWGIKNPILSEKDKRLPTIKTLAKELGAKLQ